MQRLHDSPVFFVKEIIGATPDAWQIECLKAVKENNRIAVRSGHG